MVLTTRPKAGQRSSQSYTFHTQRTGQRKNSEAAARTEGGSKVRRLSETGVKKGEGETAE